MKRCEKHAFYIYQFKHTAVRVNVRHHRNKGTRRYEIVL